MGRQEDIDRAFAELYGKKPETPEEVERRQAGKLALLGFAAGLPPYTVAGPGGKRVLVTWEEIKAIMDRKLYVGQINSRQGDGSRPYAVFSKRECAAEIAEMINRRFNSTTGEK